MYPSFICSVCIQYTTVIFSILLLIFSTLLSYSVHYCSYSVHYCHIRYTTVIFSTLLSYSVHYCHIQYTTVIFSTLLSYSVHYCSYSVHYCHIQYTMFCRSVSWRWFGIDRDCCKSTGEKTLCSCDVITHQWKFPLDIIIWHLYIVICFSSCDCIIR